MRIAEYTCVCIAELQKGYSLGQDGTIFCHPASFPPFLYSLHHLISFSEGENLSSFISAVDRVLFSSYSFIWFQSKPDIPGASGFKNLAGYEEF